MRPIQGNIATGMPVDNNTALVDAYRRDFPRRCGAGLSRKVFHDAVALSALCLLNAPPRQCVRAQGWPPTTKLCQGQPPPCPRRSLETGFQDEALDGGSKDAFQDEALDGGSKDAFQDEALDRGSKDAFQDEALDGGSKDANNLIC